MLKVGKKLLNTYHFVDNLFRCMTFQTHHKSFCYPENLEFRQTSFHDRDELFSMLGENSFEGYDNLKDSYHFFMRKQSVNGYTVTVNKQIAAFLLSFLVDGGKTAILINPRVKAEFERFVMFPMLGNYIIQDLSKTKSVKCCGLLFADVQMQKYRKGTLLNMCNMTAKRNIHPYFINNTTLCSMIGKQNTTNQEEKEEKDYKILNEVMTTESFRSNSKGSRIVKAMLPFRWERSNIPLMIDTRSNWEKTGTLFSVGTYYYVARGVLFYIDVYGELSDDLCHHIYNHLSFLKHSMVGSHDVTIEMSGVDDFQEIDWAMERNGCTRLFGYGNKAMYCYEITLSNLLKWTKQYID